MAMCMDPIDRKARQRAWRDGQRTAVRTSLPLSDPDMEALFDMLDARLTISGCDHTRRYTDAWLAEQGHQMVQVHRWLDDHGGYCDCEALANAEQAWREATGRR